MTAPSTDIARRPDQLIEHYVAEFAQVLPSHVKPEQFARLAVGALRRDPKLMAAATSDPASLMHVLMDAARLGLEPGTKEYWLIPRKIKGHDQVTGFPGWEGYVELMYRAGAVTSVKAEVVYERDEFRYSPDMDRPHHLVDWFADRGRVLGAYAYGVMAGGIVSKVVVIGPADIERAKSAAAGSERPDSPWQTDYADMVLKTAVRQLQKWVPTSAEYRREQLRAATQVAAETIDQRAVHVAAEHLPVGVDADGVIAEDNPMHYDPADYPEAEVVREDPPE